ncbi:MAG: hypothetical protein FIA97_13655 [Methylococcaceae bacterium]|nr:hypothetical protein [Methylococcaceae bacterium]
MIGSSTSRRILAALLSFALAMAAEIAPAYDEIQVYGSDINAPGQFGLEMHHNYVIDGRRRPGYPGELAPNHILAITPEFSYGVTRYFEAGLYLPFSIDVDRDISYMDGAKLRTKFLNADDPGFFYGLNIEIGTEPRRYAEDRWNAELRPIIGGTMGNWFVAFNPNLELSLSGRSKKPEFGPQIKLMRVLDSGLSVGVEHYTDLGTPDRIARSGQQNHTTYLVTDLTFGNIDVNIGIGHGWTGISDAWTAKVIVGGIPFMDAFR